AYPLSKQRLLWRKTILLFIGFTLLFNGGLIPTFLLIKKLGMLNTMWALVIPGAVNTMYLFIMRTFFEGIPEELEDAATMDGCNPFQVLLKIVLPLSVPVMVTIGLFTAVAQWNSFFNSLIYLTDKNMFPLQIHLRNVVISGSALFATRGDDGDVVVLETIKYSTLMVATAPILLIYPFIQKYFVKGALIGSIK
ncbi:MAG: binding-protein-dependent transport system inner rane component, partial [Paenibacillaceae bacterium]|nr:binding-protein-dependent transport system inner rane component [Paenibacillaceae bacterium]